MTDTIKTTEDYTDLIGEIKAHLCEHLKEHITTMLSSADKDLFDLSESASNNEDRARYFELMTQLRNIRHILSDNFIKKASEYLKPYTEVESKDAFSGEEELSLVGQEEMEDMVLIKSMSTKAASASRERLSHLEKRFEDLALKTPAVFEKTALSPVNFCQAFNDSLGIIFDLRSKKTLFDLFETYTLSTLGVVYDEINQMMIDAGILPEIRLSGTGNPAAKQQPKQPASDSQSANKQDYDVGDDFHESPSSGKSGGGPIDNRAGAQSGGSTTGSSPADQNTAAVSTNTQAQPASNAQSGAGSGMSAASGISPYSDPNSPRYAGGDTGGDTGGGTGGDTGGGTGGGTGGDTGGDTGGGTGSDTGVGTGGGTSGGTGGGESTDGYHPNYQHQTAGMPANQVGHVLTDYFGAPITGGIPSSEDDSSIAAQTAGSAQYLGHSEILTALSDVQKQPEFINPTELKFDSNAIKQSVLSSIAKQSGGVVTKRINQIAEKTINFIEMIFDAIIDDDSISDTIKTLLLRLQIPVIKASMLDQEFFIYDDHPARVLLDKIAETGIGVTDRDNEIYNTLDKIIHKIVSEYDLHTGTFQDALDVLSKFINRRERIAKEKEEAEQQKVLKEHARNTILKTLRSVTQNKRLPESIHALVLRRWPTLLFNHYVDFGKENDAWVHIVEILRDIIESIQPPETPEDLARMKANRTELTNLAREYLSRTNQSKKDLDSVISDLESTYDFIEEKSNFATEQVESAIEAISSEEPEEKPALPKVEEAPKQVLPPNIMPGMWFKVYTGEDTRPRRCKLSVIIVGESKLVFVNYAGEFIIEKSFDEFSEELDLYQSKIIMDHSVFDHALHSVITKIK